MRAVDTNVVVRFLMKDDIAQAERSRNILRAGDVYVATTVLLECEWVLRSAYQLTSQDIVIKLRSVVGLPGVRTDEPESIACALDWTEAGMDLADALHLAQAKGCSAFLSFDRKLAKRAAGRSPVPVEAP